MASIRLNNTIRNNVVSNVVEDFKTNNNYAEVEEAYKAAREALGLALFLRFSPPLEVFERVPPRYLNKLPNIRVRVCLEGDGSTGPIHQFPLPEALPMPDGGYGILGVLTSAELEEMPERKLEQDTTKALDKLDDAIRDISEEVGAILQGFASTKTLLEACPSLEPFLPAHVVDPDKAIRLPAIKSSYLERRLAEIKAEQETKNPNEPE